jgi:hypothetical protein
LVKDRPKPLSSAVVFGGDVSDPDAFCGRACDQDP